MVVAIYDLAEYDRIDDSAFLRKISGQCRLSLWACLRVRIDHRSLSSRRIDVTPMLQALLPIQSTAKYPVQILKHMI